MIDYVKFITSKSWGRLRPERSCTFRQQHLFQMFFLTEGSLARYFQDLDLKSSTDNIHASAYDRHLARA